MPDDQTIGELSRRLDAQGKRMDEGLRDINARLADMPTEKALLAMLGSRDIEMKSMREDISEIKTDAKESRHRADAAKRAAVTTAIAGGALLIGILTFVVSTIQGGAA